MKGKKEDLPERRRPSLNRPRRGASRSLRGFSVVKSPSFLRERGPHRPETLFGGGRTTSAGFTACFHSSVTALLDPLLMKRSGCPLKYVSSFRTSGIRGLSGLEKRRGKGFSYSPLAAEAAAETAHRGWARGARPDSPEPCAGPRGGELGTLHLLLEVLLRRLSHRNPFPSLWCHPRCHVSGSTSGRAALQSVGCLRGEGEPCVEVGPRRPGCGGAG